jgi:hypothetical protein
LAKEVREDFQSIFETYAPMAFVEDSEKSEPELRLVHSFVWALGLFAQKASARAKEHRWIFLAEVRSDAVHVLHSLLCGDQRGARFFLRSILENIWRHLYFRDHAVEYGWLQTRPSWYVSIEDLREHCGKLLEFSGVAAAPLKNATTGYKALSRVVHSTEATSLQLRRRLAQIRLTPAQGRDFAKDVRNFGRDVVLVLCIAEHELFAKMHPREQKLVIELLDKARKQLRQRVAP